ncbi:TPA: 4Fe-4S dicluster domain-containing protein [Candidatus Poribacteria bacterium]|nr:4Fe-4S dicluster domain-containing protein [Candidatus Poribacteria bacterium]
MKRVYAIEEYCVGCRLCELACAVAHSKEKDFTNPYRIIRAYKREFPRPMPRALVEEQGPLSFSLQCRHCEDAPCVESCTTGAMHRDERGAVVVDTQKCVGCWSCVMVCEYGAIKRDLVNRKAVKCDLCPDREIPACVEICPNGALVYEER